MGQISIVYFYLLIIFSFVFQSCINEKEHQVTDIVKNDSVIQYYNNGKIKYKSFLVNGIVEGKAISYYENGNIKEETNYKNGKMNGLLVAYYNSGEIETKQEFKNDTVFGRIEFYFKNGNVKRQMFLYHDNVSYYADFDSTGAIIKSGRKRPDWLKFWSEYPDTIKKEIRPIFKKKT